MLEADTLQFTLSSCGVPWLPASRRLGAPTLNHRLKGCYRQIHCLCYFRQQAVPATTTSPRGPSLSPRDNRLHPHLIRESSEELHLASLSPPFSQFPLPAFILVTPLPKYVTLNYDVSSCVSDSWVCLCISALQDSVYWLYYSPPHRNIVETVLGLDLNALGIRTGIIILILLLCRDLVKLNEMIYT